METFDDRLVGGRYRLEELASTTRIGETWFGRDDRDNDIVVSLVYPVDRERFLRDLAVAATVREEHIAPVVDYGLHGEACFIVTERVQGTNLAALMASPDPLPPQTVAEYGEAAAAGLSALHRSGLVHGRVRPKNLVRTEDDVCLVGATYSATMPGWNPWFAEPPAEAYFLSPEQAQGYEAGPAADVYALGATLYQLSTGRPPFEAPTAEEIIAAHIATHVVPPRSLNHDVPLALEGVILKALAKDPAQRFRSAEEMRAALGQVLRSDRPETLGAPEPAPSQPPRLRRPRLVQTERRSWWRASLLWPLALIVTAAVLGILTAIWATGALASGTMVPDLRGMTLGQAQHVLNKTGLSLGRVTVDAGVDAQGANAWVVSQTPAAGNDVQPGAGVDLHLGVTRSTVPDLTGLTEAEARARAGAAGYKIGTISTIRRPGAPEGTVVDQTPGPGAPLGRGGVVDLALASSVASGVPDVVGTTQAEAVRALQRAGYVAVVQHAANSAPQGTVISQYPAAGERVQQGSAVTIIVSDGESSGPSQGQGAI